MQKATIIIGISLATFAFLIIAIVGGTFSGAVGQTGPNQTQ